MNIIKRILLEAGVMDKKITNPSTGRQIKVSSALNYADSEPVKKKALQMVGNKSTAVKEKPKAKSVPKPAPVKTVNIKKEQPVAKAKVPPKNIKVKTETGTEEVKANAKSHKPKSKSYGISKECVDILKSKGYKDLNVLPQSFVKPADLKFNPEIESKGADNVWVVKFPVILPNGKDAFKTAYTKNFMRKSQAKKYKKISKIKESDINSLEEKTNKMLSHNEKVISDSACVIGIILKTGLRVGSVDENETGNLGVRTLKKENIKITGDKIELNFIGKSYQDNKALFNSAPLASYLSKSIKDKQDKDNIFECSYGQIGKLMETINPKKINPKDLRTYKATEFAKKLLQSKQLGAPPPLPKDPKEIKKVVKEKLAGVFEEVSKLLNNSPAMARNSYVHPVVITDFLTALGLEPKEVGYKHITLEAKESKSNNIKFTSMDEMFSKNYETDNDDSGISDLDSDECEEYLIPDWFYDDNIELK